MKIGVVSDSHDNMPAVRRLVEMFNGLKLEWLVHAGDIVAPFAAKEFRKFSGRLVAVFGNNDGERRGLKRILGEIFYPPQTFEIDGRRILVAHEIAEVAPRPADKRPDMIICGHTHEAFVGDTAEAGLKETVGNGIPFLNPGECCGYLTGRCTAAVIDLDGLKTEIVEIRL